MKRAPLIVGLGEVLWDLLPSGKVLGGAPANFAYMANLLGDRGVVASRVGVDALGQEACAVMASLGVSTEYLQQDCEHETGCAEVAIDDAGQPIFTSKSPFPGTFLNGRRPGKNLRARLTLFVLAPWRSAQPPQPLRSTAFCGRLVPRPFGSLT